MEITHRTLCVQTVVFVHIYNPSLTQEKKNPREFSCTDCLHRSITMSGNSLSYLTLGQYPLSPTSANPLAARFCWASCMPHHSPALWLLVLSLSGLKDTVFWGVSAFITVFHKDYAPNKLVKHILHHGTHLLTTQGRTILKTEHSAIFHQSLSLPL